MCLGGAKVEAGDARGGVAALLMSHHTRHQQQQWDAVIPALRRALEAMTHGGDRGGDSGCDGSSDAAVAAAMRALSCAACSGLLYDPVTHTCGASFGVLCVAHKPAGCVGADAAACSRLTVCPGCQGMQVDTTPLRRNVALAAAAEKLLPDWGAVTAVLRDVKALIADTVTTTLSPAVDGTAGTAESEQVPKFQAALERVASGMATLSTESGVARGHLLALQAALLLWSDQPQAACDVLASPPGGAVLAPLLLVHSQACTDLGNHDEALTLMVRAVATSPTPAALAPLLLTAITACAALPTTLSTQLFDKVARQLEDAGRDVSTVLDLDPVTGLHEDLECRLCFALRVQSVTTPCGHSFCRACLSRVLDHTPSCPVCRADLRAFLARHQFHTTEALDSLAKACFPQEFAAREEEARAEALDPTEIPVFVCSLAFPGIPCPLHVFEPRYRLMMRRCMENGTKVFGMCMPGPNGFSDYGCLLHINGLELLPDGRSLVDTIGTRRFKVLRRGVRDGYSTAEVEYIDDEPLDAAAVAALPEVREQVAELVGQLPAGLEEHIGSCPSDPGLASFWLAHAFQLPPSLVDYLLPSTNAVERLRSVQDLLRETSRARPLCPIS
eukprot:m.188528 g.188528  ORF g.188528 m.188528 type:complete len:615 (-) comp18189_c1_seq2:119-1963(-)